MKSKKPDLAGIPPTAKKNKFGAFTLLELLIVVAVISILAAILLPVLDKAKQKSQGVQCLNNLRQIALGLKMYNNDNSGFFPLNLAGNADTDQIVNWVAGRMDYGYPTENTNGALLVDTVHSQLGLYVKNSGVYRCPADLSTQYPHLQGSPRVRSYSMSGAIGCQDLAGDLRGDPFMVLQTFPPPPPASEWRVYTKDSQIIGSIGPADIWILGDEDPDTINDGVFGSMMASASDRSTWIWDDLPAKYHNNSCPFTFADGHAEIHRWQYPDLIPAVTYSPTLDSWTMNNDPDILWLTAHTTVPVP